MSEALLKTLPYLAPPLLGAMIGYVTNYIAIRMLFRPLRAWRIFGVRVPLTPGIIPSKREELARRIGDMVGSHLVTSDEVAQALQRESFQLELRQAVAGKLGGLLDKELGPLCDLVPDKFKERFQELTETLRWKAVRGLFEYLESPAFKARLEAWLQEKSDALLAREPASLLGTLQRNALERHVRRKAVAWLQSDKVGRQAGQLVDEQLQKLLESSQPLRELVPDDLVDGVQRWIEGELPPLMERLLTLLQDPQVRQRLAERAQEAIAGFTESLGMMGGLVAGFLTPEKISEYLPGLLDRAGDEIGRCLAEEQTRRRIAEVIRERFDDLLEKSPADLLSKVPYGRIARIRRFVRARVVVTLRGAAAGKSLEALFDRMLDPLRQRTLGELLTDLLPTGGMPMARRALTERLRTAICSPAAQAALDRELAVLIENWLFEHPLGRLSARMSSEVRQELEDGLHAQLVQLLSREVPPLVDSLDVSRMVEDKVNSLDILAVESLLLGIMQEQFKYINLFGALLGGIIGTVNLLVMGSF
ncbi:hypothetical protein Pcar_0273 [Syntrophotalea carbinolica DSM 2380]|uniref:DUF445 domain-containing protein n=2 Tax=Syntrophotalea carbinolica TaxID=19 RepID=Q3A7W0_SYNC1|nr:hypothetical protein Pcar_0273 [Syntrophotalea carbinolica DSM 2380]